MDGSSLNAMISLPAPIAGALAALFVLLLVLALRRAGAGATRLLLPIAAVVMAGLAVVSVLDRMVQNERAAERRALEQRDIALTAQAVAPGSMLGCLDSAAGEKVESACEKAVFADPQSAAGAVAYVTARLALLADALDFARRADPGFADTLAGLRRSIELDRFGIAAHVLSSRDGCTAERCPAFALLRDTSALQANLRVRAYNEYVARHVAAWNNEAPAEKPPPVASAPAPTSPAVANAPALPATVGAPVSSRYDFPSAASIPPVSIMNAEPPLPPAAAAANAAAPEPAQAAEPTAKVPVPPRRPPTQAATPPAR
jgi:hypothetical protein